MKKLIVLLAVIVAAFMLTGLAYADDEEDPNHDIYATSRGTYVTPSEPLTEWLNTNEDFSHSHDIYIPTRRNPMGIGLNVIVYQGGNLLEKAIVETKHDFGNDESSYYLVGEVNLFKAAMSLIK